MLTDKFLKIERPHLGGVQRIYQLPNGWGISAINTPIVHCNPFAWEFAVLNPDGYINYSTELTGDVEVFADEKDANDWLKHAFEILAKK